MLTVKDLLCSPTFLQSLTPSERSELLKPGNTGKQQQLLLAVNYSSPVYLLQPFI